jgi:hypothetical protein
MTVNQRQLNNEKQFFQAILKMLILELVISWKEKHRYNSPKTFQEALLNT